MLSSLQPIINTLCSRGKITHWPNNPEEQVWPDMKKVEGTDVEEMQGQENRLLEGVLYKHLEDLLYKPENV